MAYLLFLLQPSSVLGLFFGTLTKFESHIQISDKDSGGYWELLSGISILSLQ